MTVADATAPNQGASLAFEFDLAHGPAKMWRAVTDPMLLAHWLLPVVGLELTPGAAFTLQTAAHSDWDGRVNCSVLEVEEHKKLSYAWVVGAMNTVVTFMLTPTASARRLSLLHTGIGSGQKQNFGGARYLSP